MMKHAIAALLLVVAVIHLLPLAGAAGSRQLRALYGIEIDSPDLEILMRHRAVLFGILGGFFAYAAFVPALQPVAFVAAAMSILSFFYLAGKVGGYGPAIRKVVRADVVAAVCLAAAVVLYTLSAGPH